jgi:hypothetical protein
MTCWFDVLAGGDAPSTLRNLWRKLEADERADERADWKPRSILEMIKVEQQCAYPIDKTFSVSAANGQKRNVSLYK